MKSAGKYAIATLALAGLFAACEPHDHGEDHARYRIVAVGRDLVDVYLLDTKEGRVWVRTPPSPMRDAVGEVRWTYVPREEPREEDRR